MKEVKPVVLVIWSQQPLLHQGVIDNDMPVSLGLVPRGGALAA